jgi:hypothetical protein
MKYTLERAKVLYIGDYERVYELWNGKICVIPEYQLSQMLHGKAIFGSRVEGYMDNWSFTAEALEVADLIDDLGIPRKVIICSQDQIGSVVKLFRNEIHGNKE